MIEYSKTTTLMELALIATPYDETIHNKDIFIYIIQEHPELYDSFEKKYSEELAKAVREKGEVRFIVNNNFKNRLETPEVRFYLCGKEELPTISLDY